MELEAPNNFRELENYASGGIFYSHVSVEVLESRVWHALYAVDDADLRGGASIFDFRIVFFATCVRELLPYCPSKRSILL